MAAAKAVAPDLLSYDYRTIEQDLARAAGHTTGALTRHYKELSGTLVAKAKAERTVQTAVGRGRRAWSVPNPAGWRFCCS